MKQKKTSLKRLPTIYIGKNVIQEMLIKINMPKGEVGKIIGLSIGGFHKVTHVSGKMNVECWEKFKNLYFSKGFDKLPQVQEIKSDKESDNQVSSYRNEIRLQTCSLEDLIDEIQSRGYKVTLERYR